MGLVELGEHRARVAKADLQALLFGFLGRAVAHVLEELPKVFFVRSRKPAMKVLAVIRVHGGDKGGGGQPADVAGPPQGVKWHPGVRRRPNEYIVPRGEDRCL